MQTMTPANSEEKLLFLLQTTETLLKEAKSEGEKVNEFLSNFKEKVSPVTAQSSLNKKEIKKIEETENNSLIFGGALIASVAFQLLFIVNPAVSAIGVLLIGALLIKTYTRKKKPQEAIQEL